MGSKISVFIIVLAMLVLAGLATDAPQMSSEENLVGEDRPKTYEETEKIKQTPKDFLFENYPLAEEGRYEGVISKIDFSTNPLAKNYEEIITTSVESVGVNFAGNYSIATWSCGPECQNSAIVNVIDGSIHTYGIMSAYGLSFGADSTLLVINPKENIRESILDGSQAETDYYSIEDEGLVFQGKEVNGKGIVDDCIQAIANARNKITNEVIEFSTPCKVPFGWELIP